MAARCRSCIDSEQSFRRSQVGLGSNAKRKEQKDGQAEGR